MIAISSAVSERIRSAYGRDAEIIHPPVDTEFFAPDPAIDREDFVLFAGRMVAYKRPDLVVDAFRTSRTRVVMVGQGPLLAPLRKASPPHIEFTGPVAAGELRALFHRAAALVYPGEEDFGITMAEAIACGCPVVAHDSGGARDIIVPGVNGLLVPDNSPETLRRALRTVREMELAKGSLSESVAHFNEERFRREITGAARGLLP